jgi:hypothetical protein
LDERVERVKVFAFIDSQKADFDVRTLCEVCEIGRSSYYDWAAMVAAGPDEATWAEAAFANRVFDIWAASRGRYGSPRVTAALWRAGIVANHKRVERVMAELGISGRCGRRKIRTTVRDPNATLASDLVNRDFSAERPDVLWVGDITYVPTGEGWVYVASVLDACTRRLVGWSIADHMRTELVSDALRAAAATRGRVRLDGLTVHSDHGCQGGINRSSQHLDHGGVRWDVAAKSCPRRRQVPGGSGRRTGPCAGRCVLPDGRSPRGQFCGSSGG